MCDWIVASEASKFCFPEVARGLFPGLLGPYRLARAVGLPSAKEMVLSGVSDVWERVMASSYRHTAIDKYKNRAVSTLIVPRGPSALVLLHRAA
eukprot:SAG11_NODE_32561_length_282_cov_1.409836_1_plen_93_part_11